MIATMHPMHIVLPCLLASAFSVSAATLDLKIPTLKSNPGQQVVVPILVKANQGIGSLELERVFDPKILEMLARTQPGQIDVGSPSWGQHGSTEPSLPQCLCS